VAGMHTQQQTKRHWDSRNFGFPRTGKLWRTTPVHSFLVCKTHGPPAPPPRKIGCIFYDTPFFSVFFQFFFHADYNWLQHVCGRIAIGPFTRMTSPAHDFAPCAWESKYPLSARIWRHTARGFAARMHVRTEDTENLILTQSVSAHQHLCSQMKYKVENGISDK
jgi:hypothetical protein